MLSVFDELFTSGYTIEVERTLVLLKPDCVERGLIGQIIARFERKGLAICALKMIHMDREMAEAHYSEHKDKPFFELLVRYMMHGPLVAMVLCAPGSVEIVRTMIGNTDGAEAAAGTVRGDFAMCKTYNLVHASDCPESARKEIEFFFETSEMFKVPVSGWQECEEK
ncbi:MAG: nucleoside-diphosphate kinase [Planctomycetota bacterium]|nr:nucleoside-diphosphate kinase [Planctomycetota bacterium]